MTALVRYVVSGLLILSLTLGLGWYAYSQHSKAATLSLQVDDLKAQLVIADKINTAVTAASDTKAKAADEARKRKELADDATKKALKANPDWSAQRVPDDILDAIGM